VTGNYEPGHAGVDIDHGADGILRVWLAVDPGCDSVVDAEDVDFLRMNSQSSSSPRRFRIHARDTHESTPPSLHIVFRQRHRRRPNTSTRENDIRSSPESLADLCEQVVRVSFFRDIRHHSQKRGRTRVQSLKRPNTLIELLLAPATDDNTFGSCSGPDTRDCLMGS
jgi:hypothetical protein